MNVLGYQKSLFGVKNVFITHPLRNETISSFVMFQTQDENGFQKSFFVSELQELEVRAKFGQTDQNGQI